MIKLEGVQKHYGDTIALRDVNLSINRGEFIAILGPSGCGKTSLLRLLAGFVRPNEGTIQVGDQVVADRHESKKPEQRNIGMVFQSFALWPHMTVAEHVSFALDNHRFTNERTKQEKMARVEQVLRMVGMFDYRKRLPSALSGGQQQRVALARAIAPEPELLLMDEPLSALDAELRISMRKEIQQIHRQLQSTIIYVTHDQSEALAMADRVVVMNEGKIEQADTPENIYQYPASAFVAAFVGKANLIPGKWERQTFYPKHYPNVKWTVKRIAARFKKEGVMPVRPEQWLIKPTAEGQLTGKIELVQFQGNERHYHIKLPHETVVVTEAVHRQRYKMGELVGLSLRNEEDLEMNHASYKVL